MATDNKNRVFISYHGGKGIGAKSSYGKAVELKEYFESHTDGTIKCYLCQNENPNNYYQSINDALDECDWLILVASDYQSLKDSIWIARELQSFDGQILNGVKGKHSFISAFTFGGLSAADLCKYNRFLFESVDIVAGDGGFERLYQRVKKAIDQQKKVNADSQVTSVDKDIASTQTQAIQTEQKQAKQKIELPNLNFESNQSIGDSQTEKIKGAFALFGIVANVVDKKDGPRFTQYKVRISMPKGRSITTIGAYQEDVAMALGVESVRINHLYGESAIAIEVPKKKNNVVNYATMMQSDDFQAKVTSTVIPFGESVGGYEFFDLKQTMHTLIAGTTGSGKTNFLHTLIASLILSSTPEQLRFLMIDPKCVELSMYNGLPHLLTSKVVNSVDKAIGALNWIVEEIENRIARMTKNGFRNIDDFNAYCQDNDVEPMPRIVIVVDEMADLITVNKKAFEEAIIRICRLARPAGIHMILTTQRPSVDVVSGTVKANVPTRIAFRTASSIDSRVVLDSLGAEKLLGLGDMLVKTQYLSEVVRLQSFYIDDKTLKTIVEFAKEKYVAILDESLEMVTSTNPKAVAFASLSAELRKDVFNALQIGVDLNKTSKTQGFSTTCIQLNMDVGFVRASTIFDVIEKLGYLSADKKNAKIKRVNLSQSELDVLIEQNS